MTVRPFHIDIPDAVVRDLQDRLARTRWPSVVAPDSWEDGAGLSFMTHLVDHWRHRFDSRAQETRLNALQFLSIRRYLVLMFAALVILLSIAAMTI